ncbi:hypothetical protein [Polyangium aurulentum]|uniref:hypothetical protein n=1 Tax=Polyangium aurulentum TaxID=2567896 RepID=UPI0010AE849C|nr:hypothetical protein [Polyangium aurulentum]UQA63184.1 hypothetical protein E8A73_023050 [Polyangium aurulentum]
MSAADSTADEIALHGVTLRQYAAINAGLVEGHALEALLASEGLDRAHWAEASEAWVARLVQDLEGEGGLAEAYDAGLAEARERYGRRLPPLDEDLQSWFDFMRRWSACPEPRALLEQLDLRPSDVSRLQRSWGRRISAEPALAREAQRILAREAGPLPEVRPRAVVLYEPSRAREEAAVAMPPQASLESARPGEEPAPPLFAPLPGQMEDPLAPEADREMARLALARLPPEPLPSVNAAPLWPAPSAIVAPVITEQPAASIDFTMTMPAVDPADLPAPLPFQPPAVGVDLMMMTMPAVDPANLPAPLPFQPPTPTTENAAAGISSLAHYASLCAELAVFPGAAEAIFHRHGLGDPARRAAADAAWKARLGQDPAIHREWQDRYRHYHAYWTAEARRRGG